VGLQTLSRHRGLVPTFSFLGWNPDNSRSSRPLLKKVENKKALASAFSFYAKKDPNYKIPGQPG
jgi:hypothetical protein